MNITDINSSLTILFLIIISFGVSHGAADSIIIWKTFPKFKTKAIAFLIYLSIVLLGLILWFQSPILGLVLLLLMSIFHFGHSDLSHLARAPQSMKISWGIVMTLLPVIFFEKDVKSIFDALTKSDINLQVFVMLKFITIAFIASFLILLYLDKVITKKDKLFLAFEFLITIILASFMQPVYWFTFYFCFLHGLRALINIGIKSLRDLMFLVAFTLPVTFFSYFLLFEHLQINYLNIIFSVLMALTISHMLLPLMNRLLLSRLYKR
ncbi:Brp/Blh family beta-carotene 15,15'-dioxygenase [Candidatus Methylopumilus universalis]|uniref:Brp/Blh family beta-carotene 15,15'-dioxygenase n=1 Tax=Candidatus Methylopumilus universalis TaxID=2588536 RepID=UPI0016791987|nr:Brp/Blh family beta-carotene 15,15'-dioxygenase [Candidatus Methylopumilus universalis]